MHKTLLRAIKEARQTQKSPSPIPPQPKVVIFAEVVGESRRPLECPIQSAKTYSLVASLHNLSNGKELSEINFVIDTGCQFSILIPSFIADQLGLDNPSLIGGMGIGSVDGGSSDGRTYEILINIEGIEIHTTATVSANATEKALIGTELLSLFDVHFSSESCVLRLAKNL